MMKGIFLLLGSNLGDSEKVLSTARTHIQASAGKIIRSSAIYKTKAWGISEQPDFLNQVIEIESSLQPEDLMDVLLNIEKEMGRVRYKKWYARLIDIDILYYGAMVIKTENLTIPHPENQNRNFVLVPMAEIAPTLIHPLLGMTQTDLLKNTSDPLEVYPLGEKA